MTNEQIPTVQTLSDEEKVQIREIAAPFHSIYGFDEIGFACAIFEMLRNRGKEEQT